MIDWKSQRSELEAAASISFSYSDVCRNFGIITKGGNIKTVRKWINFFDIDVNHFKPQAVREYIKKFTLEEVFVENSNVQRSYAKKLILQNNLIAYECRKCKCDGTWQGELITLQLEHKNGINNDHRLSNLEFLCPNCHSQTATYAGKNARKTNTATVCTEEIMQKRIARADALENVKNNVINSGIDFSKFGWAKKVSEILEIHPSKVRPWIQRHLPELHEKCFKKKTF